MTFGYFIAAVGLGDLAWLFGCIVYCGCLQWVCGLLFGIIGVVVGVVLVVCCLYFCFALIDCLSLPTVCCGVTCLSVAHIGCAGCFAWGSCFIRWFGVLCLILELVGYF